MIITPPRFLAKRIATCSVHHPGFYGSSHKTYLVTEWHAPRCYGNFTRTLYNGLGQVVTEQKPYQDWSDVVDGCGVAGQGQEIDVNYAYDALGNPTKTSVPRLVARANFATRGADLSVATTTSYDALSRPATVTAPNGEVTTPMRDAPPASTPATAPKPPTWLTPTR